MRRGIKNYLSIRVKGMDLTECSDLKFYVDQNGITSTYSGEADLDDHEVMHVEIPKTDALQFSKGRVQVQVALTDIAGIPRSHDPIWVYMGDFLEVTGYGS